MSERNEIKTTGLSYEQMQELLLKVVEAANKPNWLEQRKIDEETSRIRRRELLAVELGRAEEESRWRRQNSCTHSRHAQTGEGVPRGTGVWTTSGQVNSDDSISLICMRCATHWLFQASHQEREYAHNAGLLGFPPPPIARCLNKADFVQRPQPKEVMQ